MSDPAAGQRSRALPVDRPRPLAPSFVRSRLHVSLRPGHAAAGWPQLGADPCPLLVGALHGLLARYNDEDGASTGVALPSPHAGRPAVQSVHTASGPDPTLGQLAEDAALALPPPGSQPIQSGLPGQQSAWRTLFVLSDSRAETREARAVQATDLGHLAAPMAASDLCLVVEAGSWLTVCEYEADLYDEASIAAFLERYRRLVHLAVARPGARLWDVSLDESLLRPAAANPHADGGGTLNALLDRRPTTHPGASLRAAGEPIARELIGRGVAPGDRVGVLLDRSRASLIAMIGILGAGAACVPLDPGWAAEQRSFVYRDCGARLILAPRGRRDLVPSGMPLVIVEDVPAGRAVQLPVVRRDDLAFVQYTDGPAGRPIGTRVAHAAMCAAVLALLEHRSPAGAGREVPPAATGVGMARLWAEMLGREPTAGAAAAVTTGVYCPPGLANPVAVVDEEGGDLLTSFGNGTDLLVLDRRWRPAPAGTIGALCVAGLGAGAGFHECPELTAERFIPDPTPGARGARIYRSPDLARRRHDQTIELVERVPLPVVSSWSRVELGAAERALSDGPVAECAVVQLDGSPPVAYLVRRGGDSASVGEWIRGRLEDHGVAAHVVLAALPRGTMGEVEFDLLPLPTADLLGHSEPTRLPRTPLERALAEMWAEVLRVPAVGLEDDFFALGGHSLLAMRVEASVRAAFGVALPPRLLFDHPTVAGVAAAVESLIRQQVDQLSDEEVDAALAAEEDDEPDA
jgi:hypothetical protein